MFKVFAALAFICFAALPANAQTKIKIGHYVAANGMELWVERGQAIRLNFIIMDRSRCDGRSFHIVTYQLPPDYAGQVIADTGIRDIEESLLCQGVPVRIDIPQQSAAFQQPSPNISVVFYNILPTGPVVFNFTSPLQKKKTQARLIQSSLRKRGPLWKRGGFPSFPAPID